jgi:hypothetical protein
MNYRGGPNPAMIHFGILAVMCSVISHRRPPTSARLGIEMIESSALRVFEIKQVRRSSATCAQLHAQIAASTFGSQALR